LFWEPSNVQAACGRCNYSHGARLGAANRRDALVADLEQIIEEQQTRIDELTAALATVTDGTAPELARTSARPANRSPLVRSRPDRFQGG
jgi:hypothetical protein